MPPAAARKHSRLINKRFSVRSINENSGYEITDKNTSSRLLQSLNQQRCDEVLCDVKLKAQGGSVPAHKNVLAASCEYFNAMFSHQMAETDAAEVTLEGVDVNMLNHVISFIYTGVLQVEKNEVPELAMLTDMLQMVDLKDRCVQLMSEEIDINNCVGMFEFAQKFHCEILEQKSAQVIKHRFPAVCRSEELLALPPQILAEIISWKDLVLGNAGENLVAETVLRWLRHDTDGRKEPFLLEVLPHLILRNVSGALVEEISAIGDESQQDGREWRRQVELQAEGSEGMRRTATYRVCVGGGFLQSRTGPNCPRLDTVETLTVTESQLATLSRHVTSEPTTTPPSDNIGWSFMAPLPLLPSFVRAFNIEGNLVCIACKIPETGFEIVPAPPECVVLEYSAVREIWERVTVPQELLEIFAQSFMQMGAMTYCAKRRNLYVMTNNVLVCAHVEVDNEEIAMNRIEYLQRDLKSLRALEAKHGSRSQSEDSADRSNADTLEDADVDLMENSDSESGSNVRLCQFALVTHDEKLYVVGGADVISKTQHVPRASLLMFDVDARTWRIMAEMTQSRASLTAVVLGDAIYAIGGYNRFRLRTAERYDCAENRWSRLADMDKFRSNTSSVVVGNKIMVLGGKSYAHGCGGARKVLNAVELYSPGGDTWTTIAPMNSARCMAMAATF